MIRSAIANVLRWLQNQSLIDLLAVDCLEPETAHRTAPRIARRTSTCKTIAHVPSSTISIAHCHNVNQRKMSIRLVILALSAEGIEAWAAMITFAREFFFNFFFLI